MGPADQEINMGEKKRKRKVEESGECVERERQTRQRTITIPFSTGKIINFHQITGFFKIIIIRQFTLPLK